MDLKSLLIDLPRWQKRVLVLACDVMLCIASVWLSFYLRLGAFQELSSQVLTTIGLSVVLAVPIFIYCGLYRAIFRYEGYGASVAIAQAMFMYALVFSLALTLLRWMNIIWVPRTIGIIQPLVLFAEILVSRLLLNEYQMQMKSSRLPIL